MSTPKLERAKNGYWYALWSDAGRSRRKSMGTQDGAVAQERFAHWLLMRGRVVEEAKVFTIADIWQVYLEKHVYPNCVARSSPATREGPLLAFFGHMVPADIDQEVVDEYVRRRCAGTLGPRWGPIRPGSVRTDLVALLAAVRFAARRPWSMVDTTAIPDVTLPPAPMPRERWLSLDEMQRLLDAARARRPGAELTAVELFLWIALETAARKQAIQDLTWDRVNFDVNVIHFAKPGAATTRKRRAAVPISASLRPVLERAWAERDTRSALVVRPTASIWAQIQQVAVAAGFERKGAQTTGISPHVLRHTAATHMARRGVSLWVVAKILGNTLAVTERVYAKWAPDDPAGTVDLISGGALRAPE